MKSLFKKAFGFSICLLGIIGISSCDNNKNNNNSTTDDSIETETHEYGNWEIAVAPTSTSTGTIKRKSLDSDDVEVAIIPAINENDYKVETVKEATCLDLGEYKYIYIKDNQEISFTYERYGSHSDGAICKTCGTIINEGFFNKIYLENIEDVSVELKNFTVGSGNDSYVFNGNIKGVIDDEKYIELYGDIQEAKTTKVEGSDPTVTELEWALYYSKDALNIKNNDEITVISSTDAVDESKPYYELYNVFKTALGYISTEGKYSLQNIEVSSGIAFINTLFKLVDYSDDYVFELDQSKLNAVNDLLYQEKLSTIIDTLAGAGTSKTITKALNAFLELDAQTVLSFVIQNNVKINELEVQINGYLAMISNLLKINNLSLGSLLSYKGTLADYLYNNFNTTGTVTDVIASMIGKHQVLKLIFGTDLDVNSIITKLIDYINNHTLYEFVAKIVAKIAPTYESYESFISAYVGNLNIAKEELEKFLASFDEAEEIYETIDALISILKIYFEEIEFTLDSETGVLAEFKIKLLAIPGVNIPIPSGSLIIKTNSGVTITDAEKAIFNI